MKYELMDKNKNAQYFLVENEQGERLLMFFFEKHTKGKTG